jgi:hypothetical protein
MAYQLGNIPFLSTVHLSGESSSAWVGPLLASSPTLLTVSRLALVALATVVAAVAFSRARSLAGREGDGLWRPGWRLVGLGGAVYTLVAVVLSL